MDGASRQPRQQSGRAGGGKVKANIKVKLCKSALLPFKKALLYARSLKLKTLKEWEAWRMTGKRPENIPSTPQAVYKHDGWQAWGHWLGTGTVASNDKQFLPFKKALLHASSLKLKSQKDWRALAKSGGARPVNMPASPHRTYTHDGWQGYGHWLGTGNVGVQKDQQFLPFKKALLYARSLKLKSENEWREWSTRGERPGTMPADPCKCYKHDGWQGWGHWLGTGTVAVKCQKFLPFKQALLYARSLDIKTVKQWKEWCKGDARPANMPSTPSRTYMNEGWQGYGHWLGTGTVAHKDKQFLQFMKALLYARSLNLKSEKEYRAWCKTDERPANMPSHPDVSYKHEGWQGYGHWLGTGNAGVKKDQQFLPFKEALLHARSWKLESKSEWEAWAKSGARPANIPSAPNQVYTHDGWQGYGHWLGTGKVVPNDQQFLPFKKALLLARCLKLKNQKEWEA